MALTEPLPNPMAKKKTSAPKGKPTTKKAGAKKAAKPAVKGKAKKTTPAKAAKPKTKAKPVVRSKAPAKGAKVKPAAKPKAVKKAAAKKVVAAKPIKKIVKVAPKTSPSRTSGKAVAKKVAKPAPVKKTAPVAKPAPAKAAPAPKVAPAKAAPAKAPAPVAKAEGMVAPKPMPKPAPKKLPLKERVVMEFYLNSTPTALYDLISSPSGFSEWYCQDVDVRDDQYTFIWGEQEREETTLIGRKLGEVIRFRRNDDEDPEAFYEMRIRVDAMTNEVCLVVTDHAWPPEVAETKQLWESQIHELKRVLGA